MGRGQLDGQKNNAKVILRGALAAMRAILHPPVAHGRPEQQAQRANKSTFRPLAATEIASSTFFGSVMCRFSRNSAESTTAVQKRNCVHTHPDTDEPCRISSTSTSRLMDGKRLASRNTRR